MWQVPWLCPEHIPSLADLLPIASHLENAFQQGSCTVQAQLIAGGVVQNVVWHFIKVCCCFDGGNLAH
jgi:hypothetical protein